MASLRIALALLCLLAATAAAAPEPLLETSSDQAAGTCFPTCRDGYVCSPQNTCVSACNPLCTAGETCAGDGTCVAEAARPVTTAAPVEERDPLIRIAPRVGGVYQYWKLSSKALGGGAPSNAGVGGIAGGIELAIERWHLVTVPRVVAVFGSDSQVELGIDLGVRFARRLGSGRVGIDGLFTPMLFPGVASEGAGFYWGGRGDLFFERGALRVIVGVGYGHIATFTPDGTVSSFELGIAYSL